MIARTVLVALLLAAPAISAEGEVAQPLGTVAVLPLRIDRLQGNTAQRLDLLLRARVEKRSRMGVQPAETTASLVEGAQSLGVDCELVTVECAVRFGAIADVEYVLLGLAAGYGPEVGTDLRLVEVATRTELSRAAVLLPADFDAQAEQLSLLVETLFVPPEHPLRAGQTFVDASRVLPPGATVIVDGAPRGVAPFDERIGGLLAGPHVVEVTLDGYEPQTTRFELTAQDTYALEVSLVPGAGPRPKTGLEMALPWSVAAVGGVLLAGGAVATVIGALPWFDATAAQGELDTLAAATDSPSAQLAQDAAMLHARIEGQKRDWESWGLPAVVVGGVLAGAGLIVAGGGVTWGLLDSAEYAE